jgi:hypothetical protein
MQQKGNACSVAVKRIVRGISELIYVGMIWPSVFLTRFLQQNSRNSVMWGGVTPHSTGKLNTVRDMVCGREGDEGDCRYFDTKGASRILTGMCFETGSKSQQFASRKIIQDLRPTRTDLFFFLAALRLSIDDDGFQTRFARSSLFYLAPTRFVKARGSRFRYYCTNSETAGDFTGPKLPAPTNVEKVLR